MEAQSQRHLSDRDLRALSTADLLSLIRADINELDSLIRVRPKAKEAAKPSRQKAVPDVREAAVAEESPETMPLHMVVCCGHHMGDFPAFARVRCPFCGAWHRAGGFPLQD